MDMQFVQEIIDPAFRGNIYIIRKDIPSNVIAVGNPCRVMRTITEEDKKKYPIMKD